MIKLNSLQITNTASSQYENVVISPNGYPLLCWVEDGVLKTQEASGSVWPPANTTEHSPSGYVKMAIYGKNYLLFFLDVSSDLQCVEYNGTDFVFYKAVEVASGVTLFDVTKSSSEVKVAYTSGSKIYIVGRDNDSRVWDTGQEVVSETSDITSVSIDGFADNVSVAYTTSAKISVYQDPEDYPFPSISFTGTVSDVKIMMSSEDNFDLIYSLDGSL